MKMTYIKCPRCELNFIQKKDKVCTVCKTEMQALNLLDEENKMGLCPICKVNYITEDENVCTTCVSESDLSEEELDRMYGGVEADGEDDLDEEDDVDEDELEILGMSVEEEEEDEEDEQETIDPLDDFDDELDDEDFDEDDEDEEDR